MISYIRNKTSQLEHSLSSHDSKERMWIGAFSILIACLLFSFNSITVKTISPNYSIWMIANIRFTVGIILVFAALFITGRKVNIADRKIWLLRGLFGSLQMVTFFIGIKLTSSGRCTLLSCTYPFFVAIFGHFLFNERFNKAYFAVMLLAFIGATLVFYDGSSYPIYGNAICLLAGVLNGMAMNYVKKAREKHDSFMVYLSPCIIGFLLTAFSLADLPKIQSLHDAGFMILIGLLAFVGQIFIGFGFKFVRATVGSIIGMSEILFSIVLSFLFIAEEMPPKFFIGTALIIAALAFNHMIMKKSSG